LLLRQLFAIIDSAINSNYEEGFMMRTPPAERDGARSRRRRGQHAATSTPNRAERRVRTHRAENTETTDSFQLFLNQAARYPLLTAEEEIELAQRIERGDLEAKERLINSNVRLVISNARRYQGLGLSMQDLVQEAMLGLIRAAEKFDWRRGYKFSTYATLWIRQAMQRGLDNTGRPIRVPAHVAQRQRTVNRTTAELTTRLDREPSDEEVAAEAKLPLDEVAAMRDLTRVTTSLDAPVSEDGDATLGELRADEAPPVDEEIADHQREHTVEAALSKLPENQRRVIELRFGTGTEPVTSLREVGRELGVTQQQVRQLEEQALRRLAEDDALAAWREAA
jgi:RNA polymerase sigma factor (sigma-70 family)